MTLQTMTRQHRVELARSYLAAGAIAQGHWRRQDEQGRELVCLLAAFGKDINGTDDCPTALMPRWLARLVPAVVDGLPLHQLQRFASGLIDRAARWPVLDRDGWGRVHVGLMMEIVWYATDVARWLDASAGRVYGAKPAARERFDDVLRACDDVWRALWGPHGLEAAGEAARHQHGLARHLAVGTAGQQRIAIKAAEHAVHAAYRAADGSAVDAACYMAQAAKLARDYRSEHAAWRFVVDVLFRCLDKEIGK